MTFKNFGRQLSHAQLRLLATMCGGMALLAVVALGLSQPLAVPQASQAAATWLGDRQGYPQGYTGNAYPDYTYCWYNASGGGYGAVWYPLCDDHPGSRANWGDPSPFYSGVFSAHAPGSSSGTTIWLNTSYNWSTAGDEYPYYYVGPASCVPDSKGQCTRDKYGNIIYTCDNYPTPSGYDYVALNGSRSCYAYRKIPPQTSTSVNSVGSRPSVGVGKTLTLEWSCLPSRHVEEEYKSGQGTFSEGGWNHFALYSFTTATGATARAGSGFSTGGALYGSTNVTAPSTAGTYTYSLQCTGGASYMTHPVMSIAVTVTPAPPAPTATISAGAGDGIGVSTIVGSPVTITANYAAGAGDSLTYTTITGPNTTDNSLVSQGSPFSPKSYVFMPASAGTYTFYPSLQTTFYDYWSNWNASVTVTALARCPNGNGPEGSCTSCDSGYVLQGTAPDNSCQLACPNGSGVAGQCTACDSGYKLSGGNCVLPSGHVTTDLTVNPDRVRSGESTSLTWATTGMTSCTLTDDQTGVVLSTALSSAGTAVSNITARKSFTLNCVDNVQSYTQTAAVNLVPSVIEI